jgi:hypothetical protein
MKKWLLLGLALPTTAMAVSIEFEGLSASYCANTAFELNGFRIQHSGSFASVLDSDTRAHLAGNGSQALYAFNRSQITFSRTDGLGFVALGFDGGETWSFQPHYWATSIRAEGMTLGGQLYSQLFELDLNKSATTGLQSFQFNSEFENLSWLRFSGVGGNPEFSLDNVVLTSGPRERLASPVPEGGPGLFASAMALLGVAGGHWLSRQRRK